MHADNWAHKAKLMGYRSRAVFKLEEILSKFKPNKITTISIAQLIAEAISRVNNNESLSEIYQC